MWGLNLKVSDGGAAEHHGASVMRGHGEGDTNIVTLFFGMTAPVSLVRWKETSRVWACVRVRVFPFPGASQVNGSGAHPRGLRGRSTFVSDAFCFAWKR